MGDTELRMALRSAALEMLALCEELGVERIVVDADASGVQFVQASAWRDGEPHAIGVTGWPETEEWHD